MFVRVCVLEVMKKMLNKVWQCIYVISRVSLLLLFCTPLLSLLVCIIYALQVHIRCRCFINNVLHRIILCFTLLHGVLEKIFSVTGSHALIKKDLINLTMCLNKDTGYGFKVFKVLLSFWPLGL